MHLKQPLPEVLWKTNSKRYCSLGLEDSYAGNEQYLLHKPDYLSLILKPTKGGQN